MTELLDTFKHLKKYFELGKIYGDNDYTKNTFNAEALEGAYITTRQKVTKGGLKKYFPYKVKNESSPIKIDIKNINLGDFDEVFYKYFFVRDNYSFFMDKLEGRNPIAWGVFQRAKIKLKVKHNLMLNKSIPIALAPTFRLKIKPIKLQVKAL